MQTPMYWQEAAQVSLGKQGQSGEAKRDYGGTQGTFRSDGNVHYPDYSDSFRGAYICQSLSDCTR